MTTDNNIELANDGANNATAGLTAVDGALAEPLARFLQVTIECAVNNLPGEKPKIEATLKAATDALSVDCALVESDPDFYGVGVDLDDAPPSFIGQITREGRPVWGVGDGDVQAYIGAPILVEGMSSGVLSFWSTSPRSRTFSRLELEIVRLTAGLVGQDIAYNRLQKKLEGVENLLAIEAATDFLTGLLNRRSFLKHLDKVRERANRYDKPYTLLRIDIDDFAALQAEVGRKTSDKLIVECAERLCLAMRKADLVGRLGDYAFAILLPETDVPHAQLAAEKLLKRMREEPAIVGDDSWRLTVSIGIAGRKDTDRDAAAVMVRADRAMREAKKRGRNQYWTL